MEPKKVIKIFVSSTFKDMDVERDALRNMVAPKLNERFLKRGLSVQIVDLRHSVETDINQTTEERERRIFSICMNEIEDCHPFFLGLVGHRYGWIPDANGMIDPTELEELLPKDFPIAANEISVTVYEFLHGLFNSHFANHHAVVLMRDASSYKSLDDAMQSDFIEQNYSGELIGKFRDYLTKEHDSFLLHSYTLNPNTTDESELLEWCNTTVSLLEKMILAQVDMDDETANLSPYALAQEQYVLQSTKDFCGRKEELKACMNLVKTRKMVYITQEERGIGVSSFLCKLYQSLKADPQNVCLFHAEQANYLSDNAELSEYLYYWCGILATEFCKRNKSSNYKELQAEIDHIRKKESLLIMVINDLAEALKKDNCNIYLLVDAPNFFYLKNIDGIRMRLITRIATLRYNGSKEDNMYVMPSLCNEDMVEMTKSLRKPVQQALLKCQNAQNPRWLKFASTILDNLNKMDFVQIRQGGNKDNEQNIIDYQLHIVDELPADFDKLLNMWVDRLAVVFGREFMEKYLGLLGVCRGLSDEVLSELTHKNLDWCIYFRQMVGRQLINENTYRLFDIVLPQSKEHFSRQFGYRNTSALSELYLILKKRPETDTTRANNLFILAFLCRDFEYCIKFMSDKNNQRAKESIQAFVQLLKIDYPLFEEILLEMVSYNSISYDFYHLLYFWMELNPSSETRWAQYAATMSKVIPILQLNLEKCDTSHKAVQALALIEAYNCMNGSFINLGDSGEVEWQKNFCQIIDLFDKYNQDTPLWNLTRIMIYSEKMDALPGLEERLNYLLEHFVPFEAKNPQLPENADLYNYINLLCNTTILCSLYGKDGVYIEYLLKGIALNKKIYLEILTHDDASDYQIEAKKAQWIESVIHFFVVNENNDRKYIKMLFDAIQDVNNTLYDEYLRQESLSASFTFYCILMAKFAMLKNEENVQIGIDITDYMLKLVMVNMENHIKDGKNISYGALIDQFRKMDPAKVKYSDYYTMSIAWLLVARAHSQVMNTEYVELKTTNELIKTEELNLVFKLMVMKNKNVYDHSLDIGTLMCTALYTAVILQARTGFKDVEYAESLFRCYADMQKDKLRRFRYISHIEDWRMNNLYQHFIQQIDNHKQ